MDPALGEGKKANGYDLHRAAKFVKPAEQNWSDTQIYGFCKPDSTTQLW